MSWQLPTETELANIVYNNSFGFRAEQGSNASSPLIRDSRLAIAVVVVNRARQDIGWGWGHGTERESNPPMHASRDNKEHITGRWNALDLPGNETAYRECQNVALIALSWKSLPLDSEVLLWGAQYYKNSDDPPSPHWTMMRTLDLIKSFDSMFNPAGVRPYLGIYIDHLWLKERAMSSI